MNIELPASCSAAGKRTIRLPPSRRSKTPSRNQPKRITEFLENSAAICSQRMAASTGAAGSGVGAGAAFGTTGGGVRTTAGDGLGISISNTGCGSTGALTKGAGGADSGAGAGLGGKTGIGAGAGVAAIGATLAGRSARGAGGSPLQRPVRVSITSVRLVSSKRWRALMTATSS